VHGRRHSLHRKNQHRQHQQKPCEAHRHGAGV
jgi:hypothetical protein